jgi:hypothetical protein
VALVLSLPWSRICQSISKPKKKKRHQNQLTQIKELAWLYLLALELKLLLNKQKTHQFELSI